MLLVKLPGEILECIPGGGIAARLRKLCRLELAPDALTPADMELVTWLVDMARDLET